MTYQIKEITCNTLALSHMYCTVQPREWCQVEYNIIVFLKIKSYAKNPIYEVDQRPPP